MSSSNTWNRLKKSTLPRFFWSTNRCMLYADSFASLMTYFCIIATTFPMILRHSLSVKAFPTISHHCRRPS
jgi:hypothetical protein